MFVSEEHAELPRQHGSPRGAAEGGAGERVFPSGHSVRVG